MTTLTVEGSAPSISVDATSPQISVTGSSVVARIVDESAVDLVVAQQVVEVDVSQEEIDVSIESNPIVVSVAAGGGGTSQNINDVLVGLQWDTPSAESGNAIEITGSIRSFDGELLASSVPCLRIVVSDGAADAEPSHTAYITAAAIPVGTILAGSGTATLTIRASSGLVAIAVHETAPDVHRFLWVESARHERMFVRALDGVEELVFA